MRLHSVLPWPPIAFQPAKKTEMSRRSKAAEKAAKALAGQTQRVPPAKRDFDADESPDDRLDIIV
jgi:hypothetical protein